MKVLVTGPSGFVGSRLLSVACASYGRENVVALSSRSQALCNTIVYDKANFGVDSVDIAKLDGVEVLIHAGAYTPKSSADVDAIGGCNSNIVFMESLLGLPFKDLRKLIYLSTLDVYGQSNPVTEETPTQPSSLYGMSKLYGERMASVFAAREGVACQILRIGHVYGPGEDKYEKFLPKAIQHIVEGKSVELWGDGSELRSLIYVDDVVKAVFAAIALPSDVGIINVVSGCAISIRQLLALLAVISGRPFEVVTRERKGTKRDYIFDNSKVKAHLLPAEIDIRSGLKIEYEFVAGMH